MPAPDVIVDFVFEDGLLFLAVINIGSEPAERVRIVFDPLVKGRGGSVSVTERPLFRNVSSPWARALDPHPFGSASAYFARCEPERITVNVSYCDRAGQNFKNCHPSRFVHLPRHRLRTKELKGATTMAILRAQPYGNQHFVVDLGTGNGGPEASFCEATIPGIEIEMIEYRSGSDKESNVRKLSGLARYPELLSVAASPGRLIFMNGLTTSATAR